MADGHREQPRSRLPERVEQGAVLERAHHARPDPAASGTTPRARAAAPSPRSAAGTARRPASAGSPGGGRPPARSAPNTDTAALAEEVAVGAHLDRGRRRARPPGPRRARRWPARRAGAPAVSCTQSSWIGSGRLQGRLEHLVGDQLGHDHRHAHGQPSGARGPALHGLQQLAVEAQDLVRVAVHGAADVGEDDRPPERASSFSPERLLQLPQLAADRGLRDVQLLARARHATFANHRPEVIEVVMVEHLHAHQRYPETVEVIGCVYGWAVKNVLVRRRAVVHTIGGGST